MKSAILFALTFHYVYNINDFIAAQRGKTVKSHEINNGLIDRFNAQKGNRGGKIREKIANRNPIDAVDSFERRQSMVSRKLAAPHRRKEALAKRRKSAEKETWNEVRSNCHISNEVTCFECLAHAACHSRGNERCKNKDKQA